MGLSAFCAEDRETLEAILASALEMSRQLGVENLPIIPAWTCRYPDGALVLGEVSTVNDDLTENHFAKPVSRLPALEEDEPPLRFLCADYRY